MFIRRVFPIIGLFFCLAAFGESQQRQIKPVAVKPTSPASSQEMYTAYCAVCHGRDGKGNGPAAEVEADVGINRHNTRMFMTGSGGGSIAEQIGAKFVQEVTAVSLAVEKVHPKVYSVIELGGQDAKIIVFKDDDETGRKKKIPSMNDKCAGGTGAVIDKINAKLKIPAPELCEQKHHGIKLHKVAGKCGVFAETDINSLQKVGTPPDELMASLFEAIVLQNLSVLTRGHTLRP